MGLQTDCSASVDSHRRKENTPAPHGLNPQASATESACSFVEPFDQVVDRFTHNVIPSWVYKLPNGAPAWVHLARKKLREYELPVRHVGRTDAFYHGAYLGKACAFTGWPNQQDTLVGGDRIRISLAAGFVDHLKHAINLPAAEATDMLDGFGLMFRAVLDPKKSRRTKLQQPCFIYEALSDHWQEIEHHKANKTFRKAEDLIDFVIDKIEARHTQNACFINFSSVRKGGNARTTFCKNVKQNFDTIGLKIVPPGRPPRIAKSPVTPPRLTGYSRKLASAI